MTDADQPALSGAAATIHEISVEYFEKALMQAAVAAEQAGHPTDAILSAMANAYVRALAAVLGDQSAVRFMEAHLAHVRAVSDSQAGTA